MELEFNFSARRRVIQETWGNENTFMVWSKYLNHTPDAGPYLPWKYKVLWIVCFANANNLLVAKLM